MDVPTASVAAVAETPRVLDGGLFREAQRQFDICNACRYCEGLCAVFPALERRSLFLEGDILFLANLCHDCRECFDVCPFATPHGFGVDIPPLMSAIRQETYAGYSRPRRLGRALIEGTWSRALVSLLVVALAMLIGMVFADQLAAPPTGDGSFYEVVPFVAMTTAGFALTGIAALFMLVGVWRFWQDTAGRRPSVASLQAALYAALSLENMRGGGPGCSYPDEDLEQGRRLMHSLVFYGFLGTFVATVLAAIWQEAFGRQPPFPLLSAPVLIGTIGGIATIGGCAGLIVLKRRSRVELNQQGILRLDRDFIALLVAVNITGLGVLVMRSTTAMGWLLLVHLGLVAAFFVSLPYGKFVHATYRTGALVQDALELRDEDGP